MVPLGTPVAEWHLTTRGTDSFVAALTLVYGTAATGGGVYLLVGTELLGFPILLIAFGLALIWLAAWVFYFGSVWHVYESARGVFRCVGPCCEIRFTSGEVRSMTEWRWDFLMPIRINTMAGGFFLPRELDGPSNLIPLIMRRNGIERLDTFPF